MFKTHLMSLAFLALGVTANAQIYTQTNESGQNRLAEIRRMADGSLVKPRYIATGGMGTGAGLGVQGALAMSDDREYLFVVNAGSNDLSTFAIGAGGPRLIDRTPTGGMMPVSVTTHGNRVYVLNAGSHDITGFERDETGQLDAIAGSTRALSDMTAAPAQIGINREGDTLYVTQKNTNRIDVFSLGPHGVPSMARWIASGNSTPFGFGFGRRGKLIVSEAAGGAEGASTVSSYNSGDNGNLMPAALAVPTFQTAACWLAVTWSGRYAYAANAGSGTITGYRVFDDGTLGILTPNGLTANTGTHSHPVDMAFSRNDRRLFVLANGIGLVEAFDIDADGSLVHTHNVSGLPLTSTGLVVR